MLFCLPDQITDVLGRAMEVTHQASVANLIASVTFKVDERAVRSFEGDTTVIVPPAETFDEVDHG